MIYDIAGLRVLIDDNNAAIDKFCAAYLSCDQNSPADIVANAEEEDIKAERQLSPNLSQTVLEFACVYRSICRQMPKFNRMVLHGALVAHRDEGYAFLGKSGAGKSTHANLWIRHFPNVKMVNGDKPIIWQKDGAFIGYGTPWCGKEQLGCNDSVNIKGICFIEQSPVNQIERLSIKEATKRLFAQVLLPKEGQALEDTLRLLNDFVLSTPVYLLQCDISKQAAMLSFDTLTKRSGEGGKE